MLDSQPVAPAIDWMIGGSPDRFTLLDVAVAATVLIALLHAASA